MTGTFLDASWHRVSGLKPRLRRHLAVNRHRYRGASWYVVEDKASGRVHRFTPAVYLLVGQMNGQRTVDEIWQYIVEQLGDDAPTQGEVIQLLSQLSAADLLQTDIAPDSSRASRCSPVNPRSAKDLQRRRLSLAHCWGCRAAAPIARAQRRHHRHQRGGRAHWAE